MSNYINRGKHLRELFSVESKTPEGNKDSSFDAQLYEGGVSLETTEYPTYDSSYVHLGSRKETLKILWKMFLAVLWDTIKFK